MKNIDRQALSIAPLFQEGITPESTHLILTSPSDVGVMRNLGRNGARFAPAAVLAVLKKFNNHMASDASIGVVKVSDEAHEKQDFVQAQRNSALEIEKAVKAFSGRKVVHIGGGHDHVSPLLTALDQQGLEQLIVLNVDAHMDTRIESQPNSGTPFRDFSNRAKTPWQLYQYAIHDFANSKTTMTPFPQGNMTVISAEQVRATPKLDFIRPPSRGKTAWLFSLDVDAMEAGVFEGVSAVNHKGLSLAHVEELLRQFSSLAKDDQIYFGIYEYNPLYDNLSQKGARALAYLINSFWKV